MTYFSRAKLKQRLDFNQNFDADANCRTGQSDWIAPTLIDIVKKDKPDSQSQRNPKSKGGKACKNHTAVHKLALADVLSALLVIKASAFFLLLKEGCCCCNTAAIKAEIFWSSFFHFFGQINGWRPLEEEKAMTEKVKAALKVGDPFRTSFPHPNIFLSAGL